MGLDASEAPRASGPKTALDTIVAPAEAFESLRGAPTWGWALLIAIILMAAGYWLQRPAALHAQIGTAQRMVATSPLLVNATDEQKQRVIENARHPSAAVTAIGFISLIVVLFAACFFNAVILLAGNAIAKGSATFVTLWAGSMNIAVPTIGLGALVLGIICMVRGPDAFATTTDMMRAVPGLALVAGNAGTAFGGFLSAITVFTLWGLGLNVMLMRTAGGVKGAVAWVFPLVILILGGLLGAAGSKFTG